jgi:hypothetical protein
MSSPVVMPIISRGVPAFTNDDTSGSFPATHANDASYGGTHYWRTSFTPAGNANSGTLSTAAWLAYDLSGVPSGQRQNVVVVWYNDPATDAYDTSILAGNYNNSARDYTIDTNTAAGGGSAPGSGWATQVTVTGNPYHSRQHAFNLNGANWLRINVTGITGSALNNNVSLNMDVHDTHVGNQDNFIFFGDSITQRGFDHDDINETAGTLPAQINAVRSNLPLMEDGGIGGLSAGTAVPYFDTWLSFFGGKYVGINYGTNDANSGGSLLTNFISNYTSMINSVLNAGKIPIIHKTIPYGLTSGVLANGPTINSYLATLFATYPQVIQGPDLWAYFQANQSYIGPDNLHLTDPILGQSDGYGAYRTLWATSLLQSLYIQTRTITTSAALLTTNTRTITTSAAVTPAIQPSNATVIVRRGQQSSAVAGSTVTDDYSPIYQGDTLRPFAPVFLEQEADGTYQAVNLTGLTISMKMARWGETNGVVKTCSGTWVVDSAAGGMAHYPWQAADVDTPSIWQMYIKLTNGSGQVEHVGTKIIVILPII